MKLLAQVTIPDYSGMQGWKFGARPTVGGIASSALRYVLVFAGLAMFGYLIFGGFTLLTSAGNQAGVKKGTQAITSAILGFILVFASYWIIQLVERIFGLVIL